jgi:hypothetical protein
MVPGSTSTPIGSPPGRDVCVADVLDGGKIAGLHAMGYELTRISETSGIPGCENAAAGHQVLEGFFLRHQGVTREFGLYQHPEGADTRRGGRKAPVSASPVLSPNVVAGQG